MMEPPAATQALPPPPPPPLPPPPPPPSEPSEQARGLVEGATSALETGRCLEAELEASLLFCSSLLGHPGGLLDSESAEKLPHGIQDAWFELSEASLPPEEAAKLLKEGEYYPLGRGQLSKAAQTAALSDALQRAAAVSTELAQKISGDDVALLRQAVSLATNPGQQQQYVQLYYERLRRVREYHAQFGGNVVLAAAASSNKRMRLSNPSADGYDLASVISSSEVQKEEYFTAAEVYGKYLDLAAIHDMAVRNHVLAAAAAEERVDLVDFLSMLLSKGLATAIPESHKLNDRRKYLRLLKEMQRYLEGFLKRTSPLVDIQKEVIQPALEEFEKEWRESGGIEGWEKKPAEAHMIGNQNQSDNGDPQEAKKMLDLSRFSFAKELEQAVDGDALKVELARLGLKCGGTVSDRAKRLFLTKDTPLDQLPKKLFAKKTKKNDTTASVTGERRVDICRLEVMVTALLNQLRPTLDATLRRAERRSTQTLNEREQEVEEEIHGSMEVKEAEEGSDEEEEAPIYNPKGVPLGWDGKPIPYWLFKLHGLNHFYPCEICGNESYRGRRNFEKHFAESKHAYGMRCLGIPNTKHFHGVTKIEDAQALWKKLESTIEEEAFDGAKDEEYEDSHGNVLSRAAYEDLARQGLL